MYYPMRVVRQRKYKLIWNIAHGLDYPFASDLWASATWQATIKGGNRHYGKRTVDAYLCTGRNSSCTIWKTIRMRWRTWPTIRSIRRCWPNSRQN